MCPPGRCPLVRFARDVSTRTGGLLNRLPKIIFTAAILAAAALLSFAGAQSQSQSPTPTQSSGQTDDQTVIKQDVNLVSVYFTVRDNHKQLISSLTQDQFRVLEDGREQPVKFF